MQSRSPWWARPPAVLVNPFTLVGGANYLGVHSPTWQVAGYQQDINRLRSRSRFCKSQGGCCLSPALSGPPRGGGAAPPQPVWVSWHGRENPQCGRACQHGPCPPSVCDPKSALGPAARSEASGFHPGNSRASGVGTGLLVLGRRRLSSFPARTRPAFLKAGGGGEQPPTRREAA